MRFQKLSENKLKIFISSSELPISGSFDNFIANSLKAKDSFLDILERAYDEVGFNTTDYKIKIDAVALMNGDFVLIVTKLVKLNIKRKVAVPKVVHKNISSNNINLTNYNSTIAIYEYENFDDFCNFCAFLKKVNITDLSSFAKCIELYLYNKKYYLAISNINTNYKKISNIYSYITEFGKYFSSKDLFYSVLHEKSNLIIKNNAIEICQRDLL